MNNIQEITFYLVHGDTIEASLYHGPQGFLPEVQFLVRPEHKINYNLTPFSRPRRDPKSPERPFLSAVDAFNWMLDRVQDFTRMNGYSVARIDTIHAAPAISVEAQRACIAQRHLDWQVQLDSQG